MLLKKGLVFLLILSACTVQYASAFSHQKGGDAKVIRKIRFRFSTPDPWGDDFWQLANHDDNSWRTAKSLAEIATCVKNEKPQEVFLRLEVNHTAATINDFYFRVKHSGPFEVYVNGKKAAGATGASPGFSSYLISPRRPEMIGINIYAIHFKNEGGGIPVFGIEAKYDQWQSSDEGSWRPKPVLPDLMRDAEVCKGPDNTFYMVATTGSDEFLLPNPKYWLMNQGIQVFSSKDLQNWRSLGYVWNIEQDGTWNKQYGEFSGRKPARGIFAPEIKYHDHKFWINYSVNNATTDRFFGIGLLSADKAEGPYTEVSPAKPLTDGFDSNIFIDDDKTPYLLKQGGEIAKLKPDMSGIAEPFRHLAAANYPQVGYEGVHLFKYQGKYFLTSAEWNVHADGKIGYDSMAATADHIYGPYSNRYCALRFGGHNGYFTDSNNNLYATVWCYPDGDHHWQRVSIVKMQLDNNNHLKLVPKQVKL